MTIFPDRSVYSHPEMLSCRSCIVRVASSGVTPDGIQRGASYQTRCDTAGITALFRLPSQHMQARGPVSKERLVDASYLEQRADPK